MQKLESSELRYQKNKVRWKSFGVCRNKEARSVELDGLTSTLYVFDLEMRNLILDNFNFINLIMVRSEFKLK